MIRLVSILLVLFFSLNVFAQKQVVQFSGYVLTPDSLIGIPFVSVSVKNSNKGTISDPQGFFSFVGEAGDTIYFSSVGFRKTSYVIPSDLQSNKYSIIKLMSQDEIYIDTVTIYPWPSKDMFRQAFLSLQLEESDIDRALKNLEREYVKEMSGVMAMDANENADNYLRAQAQKYYYAGGQVPPQNIFNVFAWAQFFEAWKRGDFKKSKK
jgi:signal peptidase I